MSLSVISPGNGLRLLSFDGGGIRSISQALMVKEMMHRVQEDHQLPEPPKVSDYFDMICGSGFGGLLAIMCGILHMTGDQLVQEFIRLCKILFSGKLQTIAERTDRFENEIRKLVANYCSGEEEKKMISEESTCKTFVCAASSHNAGHPYIFRNYRSRSNPSPDCTIWEASRATTAMPDFFRPIVIRDKNVSQTFVGGMVRWSNPTDVLTKEAARLFGNRHVACIISIGSGHSGHISLAVGITNMFIAIALDCEQRADELSYRFAHVPYVFMRFSVEQGLQNLKGDLSNLDKVIAHTHSYLQGTRTSRDVDVLLNALVHRPDRILVQQISGSVASAPQIGSPKICPQPTQYFTGRLTTIKRLEEYFVSNEDSCRVAVLYGIGGSGKTQIGLEFIQRNKSRFSDVYFIDASSKFTLESDLVSIASEDSNQPSFPAAMQILRGRKKEWLLFLDNADDPSLNLRPYISWPHGNVLITTRNPEIQTHAPKCSISVDRLSPEDATKLLLRSIPTSPGSDEQKVASEIVQILGCLALAINQARAFLSKGTCTLREYLSLYKQNRKLLLEERLVQKSDDYRYSVYTTWTISFRQVSPDAALLFQLFSFMHYEAIPASLFNDAWRLLKKYNNAIPPILFKFLSGFTDSNSTWNMLRFRNLIGELLSFSLIEFHVSQNTVSFHPLVQQWAQDHCRDREDIVRCTQTLLSLAIPGIRTTKALATSRALLPHLRDCISAPALLHYTLLSPVGRVFLDGGLQSFSFQLFEQEVSEMKVELGENHPNTLMAMSNLAEACSKFGRYQDDLELNQKVLELRKQVLGPKHSDTLTTMANLAVTYSHLGRFHDALELHEHVLVLRTQVLGEDPDTLMTKGNLATTYLHLGRYQEALELNLQVFRIRERCLTKENPETLSSMTSLAVIYCKLGRYQDALLLGEQALALHRQVLGKEHPDTLIAMGNLAITYSHIDRWQEALELNEQVLELRQQVLGKEHPVTLLAMTNLAFTYSGLGQYQDALGLEEQVLALRRRISGEEHPDTLLAMGNVSTSFQNLHRHQDAVVLEETVLSIRERILGKDHPDTFMSMGNLAACYLALDQDQKAVVLAEPVYEFRRQVLGVKHPDTLTAMNNLAMCYSNIGQYNASLALHEELFELRRELQGTEHQNTLMTMANIASRYSELGRYQDALTIDKQVLTLRRKVLGENHPDTLMAMTNLACTYLHLGRNLEALILHEQALELRRRVLGENHQNTLSSIKSVELCRVKVQKQSEQLLEMSILLVVFAFAIYRGFT